MSHELTFKTSMAFNYGEPSPVSPGIVRLVANNPSVLTFKGTNTYLLGMTELAVIDPGPDDPAHREAILKAAGSRPITHILITHAHRDHVDGAAAPQGRDRRPHLRLWPRQHPCRRAESSILRAASSSITSSPRHQAR